MKSTFICANCGNRLEFTIPSKISLVCQFCGGYDLSFESEVKISPINVSDVLESEIIPKGEFIIGNHKFGCLWLVEEGLKLTLKEEGISVPYNPITIPDKDTLPTKQTTKKPKLNKESSNKSDSPVILRLRRQF